MAYDVGSVGQMTRMRSQPASPTPARARLFFSHQSVGENLIQGFGERTTGGLTIAVQALMRPEDPVDGSAALLHARLGANGKPSTKLAAFESWLGSGLAERIDYAMLKFCYVDVTTDADADDLFSSYAQSMARIRAAHPRLTLAHCTMPLRSVPEGAYATLRRVLGHRHVEYARNAARERFNDALRRSMMNEPIFDLARIEAGQDTPDPSGRKPPALLRKYTSDGGHLNDLGRRIVAMRFVDFVAGLKTR